MDARRDIFQALADPTRRDILGILSHAPQNLNALAGHFEMSRQAISLHVKILRECGAISIQQQGRERLCELEPRKLAEAAEWLKPFRKLWEDRFNELDNVLVELKNKENEHNNL